jgi:arginine-tRNA-protein transferase
MRANDDDAIWPPRKALPFIPPRELVRFRTDPKPCSYLPAETASLEYKLIAQITPEQYQQMLSRGWRRFGLLFFRPACPACSKCVSLRVPAKDFAPAQSQKRTLAKNRDVEVIVRPASCSSEHAQLFNEYHAWMREHRGWPKNEITLLEYEQHFLAPFSFAHEFLYYRCGQLAGIGLVDILPQAISSVYFYHRPEWRKDAPGIYSLLREIQHAREHGAEFAYLGYWVNGCQSMDYKAQFKPHQLLQGYPADAELPSWITPAAAP